MYKFGERYSFFAAQFMNTLYVPLGMILIAILNFVSLKKNKTKVVTKVHTKFPQIIYAYCGLLDSFGIILTAISNRKTPGELQTLFSQLTVPFSMCWSMLLLKKRYNYKAFLGSLIILGGIALSAFTHISHSNTLEFFNQNSPTNILHCATYASGFVFFSLSFVIKEWCFNHDPDSIIYVVTPANNRIFKKFLKITGLIKIIGEPVSQASPYHLATYSGAWIILFSFIVYLFQLLPSFGNFTLSELFYNFIYGAKCLVGINTYQGDNCTNSWIPALLMTLAKFIDGILAVMLTKQASALVQFISQSLTVPLIALTYAFKPIMLTYTENISSWNIISIFIILFGLGVYANGDGDLDTHSICLKIQNIYKNICKSSTDELESEEEAINKPLLYN